MPIYFAQILLEYKIVEIYGDLNIRTYLASLGLKEGSLIQVLKKYSGHIIVNLNGNNIILTKSIAKYVLI